MNPSEHIPIGHVGEASTLVDQTNIAGSIGATGRDVFSTPALIALIENAALSGVDPLLPEGWVTVGTLVNIRHLAATPMGETVTARVEVVAIDRRRLVFRVEVHDEVQKVGDGTHERFAVNLAQFMASQRPAKG